MEFPRSLVSLPREILLMILKEYFKTIVVSFIQTPIPNKVKYSSYLRDDPMEDRVAFLTLRNRTGKQLERKRRNKAKSKLAAAQRRFEIYSPLRYCVMSILKTCKEIRRASQSFLTEELLSRNMTLRHYRGLISDRSTIQVGKIIVSAANLEKVSGDERFAVMLQEAWIKSTSLYPSVKEIIVHYEGRTNMDRPSLIDPPHHLLVDLNDICAKRQIDLYIFAEFESYPKCKRQASIKALVNGFVAKVYEMKNMRRVDLWFYRRLFKKLFHCTLPVPEIEWPRGKIIGSYRNEGVLWSGW